MSGANLPQHDALTEAAVKLLGQTFDPLGGGVEGGDESLVSSVVGGRKMAALTRGEILFKLADAEHRLEQLVRNGQGRHDRQPRVADLAEFRPQLADALVEVM